MAQDSIKDFALTWVLFGLLFISLLTFSINFIYDNTDDFSSNDYYNNFNTYNSNITSQLYELDETTNALLNTTSKTDPTVSDLGSADSVSTGFGTISKPRELFQQTSSFIRYIFDGTTGQILTATIAGIFGFMALYFIVKWIRNGI